MINSVSSTQNNSSANSLASSIKNSSGKINIELVKKGEAGYMEAMDEDQDGVVTMEEFNNYCSENGVSEEDKLALLETIQSAKMTKQIQEKTQAAQKEQEKEETKESEETTSDDDENKIVYARKGDDKYNEVMDENKNGTVTYEEYMKYCQNKAENEKTGDSSNKAASKVEEAYSSSDSEIEEEISVEAEA